ncbi:MAG TPA: hypothetical protein PLY36_02685 [Spirochaetota bacterium]|nr:hypothetical protein [Spirochaetota bacterium]
MLKNYFIDFNKKIIKKSAPAKASSGKGAAKKGAVNIDAAAFIEKLDGIIPQKLRAASLKPVDSSGFSPEGADIIAYREYCRDINKVMNGYVPYELIHGAFFIVNDLNKSSLADVFTRVATVKKINHFTEEAGSFAIPSFIIAGNNQEYTLPELKNDIMNYYMSKNVSSDSEFEIMMIHNSGLLIKDWHKGDHRFIGLETGEDTMMWFFILMNEYLDVEREDVFDIRKYVRTEKSYNEF